jgi:beta-fructofuranosidase
MLLFSATLLGSVLSAFAQYTWHLDNTSLAATGKFPPRMKLASRTGRPELVKGFRGNGLRTDGYSTWLSLKKPSLNGELMISGYFALETFPTDTAAFFSVGNKNEWISAGVDRFGTVMIGIKRKDRVSYYPATGIARFKWINVGLYIRRNEVELLLNGRRIRTAALKNNEIFQNADTILIGRGRREKAIGVFPVTAINGIIDEITIGPRRIQLPYAISANTETPVLAVPESRFKDDFMRPRYHLLPAANWTNETHGLMYYQGKYHIFNQKNGANLFLGQINWGHFTSPDLLHWTEQRPALTPGAGYDQNGIWSGCTVLDDNGKPVIIYSGGGEKGISMCVAYPRDGQLNTWSKYAGNPVVDANPAEFERKDFHDPIVWKDAGSWYMAVGFGLKENGAEKGALLLYRSTDLKKWEYRHLLFTGEPEKDDSGVFWEMPLFWKLDGKYILLVNKVPHKGRPAVALYWTGDFKDEQFVPDDPMPKRLEVINRLLSPSVALDAKGNTSAIAIIPDETSARETYSRGWTHLFSIPRLWTLENGKINQRPHPVLQQLRLSPTIIAERSVSQQQNLMLSRGKQQIELSLDIDPGTARRFGVIVGKNEDGTEMSKIYFDLDKQQLIVDQTKSSRRKFVPLNIRTGDYTLEPNKKFNLHLFIDGSVIEGFINDKDAFTTRLFPLSGESNCIELFSDDSSIRLIKGTVWPLKNSTVKTAF